MEKKTECQIVQDLLLGYVDGVLNAESKKLVEKHLTECEICQNKLKDINADIEENENNQKKQIDYLKKVRRKNKIKVIIYIFILIVLILFGYYLYKFCILNNISSKASKQFESENFYKEKISKVGFAENELSISRTWYKNGKYKEIYSNKNDEDGSEKTFYIRCGDIKENSQEEYHINEQEHKVQKLTLYNRNLDGLADLPNPIHPSFRNCYLQLRLGAPFYVRISTSYETLGRKYYILEEDKVTTWVDIDTGLPIMRFGESTSTIYYDNTNIPKQSEKSISQYKYEFNNVEDSDVELPDLTGYEVEEINFEDLKK